MLSTVTTVEGAVESFILSRDLMGCTPKTVKMYREVMRDFLKSSSPGWPVTVLDIQKYVGGMKSRGLKPYTINGRLRAVRAFTSWALQAALLPDNPGKAVRFKTPRTLPSVPTQDEVMRVLRAADKTWEGLRARTMVLTMIDTGLRVSELIGLRWEDADAPTQYLTVRQGKGQKDRVVPYGSTVAQALNKWMNRQGVVRPEDFVFPSKTGRRLTPAGAFAIVQRLGRRAQLARSISPHKLRHFFATQYLRNGGDLETLRQILGHATLMMVLRYAHLISADVGRVHRRASPADQLDR
jgi:site-specific recombinase XerD